MASIHKRVIAKGEIRWLVRYRDPNKVERTRSFSLKTDAARFAAAVETDISRGDWVNPELARETFSYWADQWLATTYHLKPKTQEGYRSVLNHHLLPRLANTPVARIDLPMVTSLLSEFSRNGAGAGTVGNIRGALGLVLEQARRSGAIRTNPVADTKPPKKPQQEMIFLTPKEVVAVAEEVTNIETNPPTVGGRVILVTRDSPCLHCLGELEAAEISRWAKAPHEQALDREHGYGTLGANPAVVYLNGISVHAAIAEVVAWIAGHRRPAQY
jgi:hypothetical protein